LKGPNYVSGGIHVTCLLDIPFLQLHFIREFVLTDINDLVFI